MRGAPDAKRKANNGKGLSLQKKSGGDGLELWTRLLLKVMRCLPERGACTKKSTPGENKGESHLDSHISLMVLTSTHCIAFLILEHLH